MRRIRLTERLRSGCRCVPGSGEPCAWCERGIERHEHGDPEPPDDPSGEYEAWLDRIAP